MSKNNAYKLFLNTFKYIHGELYRPNIANRYVVVNGITYLNTAVPTERMKLNGKPEQEPKAILDLFFNLAGENYDYMQYILNWIAYGFVTGKKPLVAIVLFGPEGTGKNIFYQIMEKLYAPENCSQINAESFKSQYNAASYVENKRFINLDEITLSVSTKHESFLKALIANPTIRLGKVIELHGQCLFTANYATVFNIKDGDRRYSVFQTGSKLKENNYLGYGGYEELISKINSEMDDFAKYLDSFDINTDLVNNPLETPEKLRIIGLSKTYLQDFHNALANLDITYFTKLRNKDLLREMNLDFTMHKRINRAHLRLAYEDLFGDKISTVALMDQLRELNQEGIFEEKNIGHVGNNHYIYPRIKQNIPTYH